MNYSGHWISGGVYLGMMLAMAAWAQVQQKERSKTSVTVDPALAERVETLVKQVDALSNNKSDSAKVVSSLIRESLRNKIITNDKGVILWASRSAAALLGYSDRELIGKNSEVLMPDRFRGLHNKALAAAMLRAKAGIPNPKTGKLEMDTDNPFVCIALTKDGTEVPYNVRTRIIEEGGMFTAHVELTSPASINDVPEASPGFGSGIIRRKIVRLVMIEGEP